MASLLAISFGISNSLRVLFYLPQFHKLIKAKDPLESHSLFMWMSWIMANVTTTIYFFLQSGLDQKVIITIANTTMCCIGASIIFYKRTKYRGLSLHNETLSLEQAK